MQTDLSSSSDHFPWQTSKASWKAYGTTAEHELSRALGEPIHVCAYEPGKMGNIALQLVLAIVLLPLWLFLMVVLVVPGWIYFAYRTYKEWGEARELGVGLGWIVFMWILVLGFGIVAGVLMLQEFIITRFLPLKRVFVVRTDNHLAVLHVLPTYFVPRFSTTEVFSLKDANITLLMNEPSKSVLEVKTGKRVRRITLFRARESGLNTQLIAHNHDALIAGLPQHTGNQR